MSQCDCGVQGLVRSAWCRLCKERTKFATHAKCLHAGRTQDSLASTWTSGLPASQSPSDSVTKPRCGISSTLGKWRSGSPTGSGSVLNLSRAAKPGLATRQRLGLRGAVDQCRAGGVDPQVVWLHQRRPLGVEELAHGRRWHQMQADHLGRAQQFIERNRRRAFCSRPSSVMSGLQVMTCMPTVPGPRGRRAWHSPCPTRPRVWPCSGTTRRSVGRRAAQWLAKPSSSLRVGYRSWISSGYSWRTNTPACLRDTTKPWLSSFRRASRTGTRDTCSRHGGVRVVDALARHRRSTEDQPQHIPLNPLGQRGVAHSVETFGRGRLRIEPRQPVVGLFGG